MAGKLEDIEFKKQSYVPGPGTHNPEKPKALPSMKFGTGQRSELALKTVSPGPGNYTQDGDPGNLKSAPKFGFGTSKRTSSNANLNVPGPGNYHAKSFTGEDMPQTGRRPEEEIT